MSFVQAQLRRKDTSHSWGFRMKGGAEQGMPLFIEAVKPNGLAAQQGIQAGDIIALICGVNMQRGTHMQAKQEILRAGNDLDLVVQKGGMTGAQPPPPSQEEERAQVVEEAIPSLGGPTYKDIKPKTYQVLEDQLPPEEENPAPAAKPSSIFDRKRQERSGYLHAQGDSIQKAYGQQF